MLPLHRCHSVGVLRLLKQLRRHTSSAAATLLLLKPALLPPPAHLWLAVEWRFEVVENQHKHKQVVDAQRLLQQVASKVFLSFLTALDVPAYINKRSRGRQRAMHHTSKHS